MTNETPIAISIKVAGSFFGLCFLTLTSNAQFTYKIKADSLKITNDSCSAELILENSTRAIDGFLYNSGNGRTIFKRVLEKINDTAYLIGSDTLRFATGTLSGGYINNQYAAAQPNSRFWVSQPSRTESDLSIMGKLMIGTTSIDSGYTMKLSGGDIMIGTAIIGNGRSSYASNTAVGRSALSSNTTGTDNAAIGNYSLSANTNGNSNTAVGSLSLRDNTTGYKNTALGRGSLTFNTNGVQNTAVGVNSLYNNTSGSSNTSVGVISLQNNTTGNNNTSVGFSALGENTTGNTNVAIGISTLEKNTEGISNSAVGSYALRLNTSGNNNTALGYYAAYTNTKGLGNTALGYYALRSNDSGWYNIGVGYNAAYKIVDADANIAIGTNSLYNNISGDYNIGIGHYSGSALTGGSNNILVGNNVQPGTSTSGSNQLNIGNWIYGDNGKIGIGIASPSARLQVAAGSTSSPPLLFTQGTNTTTPMNGAVEYNGSNYLATTGGIRYVLAKTLTTTAVLDFPGTLPSASSELTVSLTGAADGDVVSLGLPNAAILANSTYMAWVSAANTITIRFCNNDAANTQDPLSGTFRVSLIKY